MILSFDKKLFAYLTLAFILFTIIGTISHEFGHLDLESMFDMKTSAPLLGRIQENKADNWLWKLQHYESQK